MDIFPDDDDGREGEDTDKPVRLITRVVVDGDADGVIKSTILVVGRLLNREDEGGGVFNPETIIDFSRILLRKERES